MRKSFITFIAIVICACFGAVADDSITEAVRAAARANVITAPLQQNTSAQSGGRITGNRQHASPALSGTTPTRAIVTSRAWDAPVSAHDGSARSGTKQPREVSVRNALPPISAQRGATSVTSRSGTQPTIIKPIINPTKTVSRTGTFPVGKMSPITVTTVRGPGIPAKSARVAATELNTASLTFGDKNYNLCRDTYFQCMDEFCSNKDAQLRRCACSSRIREFDKITKNLDKFETRMLDFNERLLTVSMDKEDAVAINKATDGEDAFQVDDKTPSQKILDAIAKKLKTTNADNKDTQNLAMITLSMDNTNVFDTIDSTLGARTSTKEGGALYRSALPVCKDIAREACSENDISIAEAAYQMNIEQDCNTVAKAHESLQAAAIQKVREGGALLDMSRLQDHQTRNADDTLTCKSKMLEMLADDAVCGANLGKCLDWSGKYIDPSTGQAILTDQLANLSNTLVPPSSDVAKWVQMKENFGFVKFLNAKKKYIEPAMVNCEKISDMVWNAFMEDALAQIKIAQTRKLEDMRQNCTSVTTTCLTGQAQLLTDFDPRALSIFGVSADKTVNQLCQHIKGACTALMTASSNVGGEDWNIGMTELARDKSYDQIIKTCLEIGKNCIVKNCVSAAGNFGLCTDLFSINRKILLDRTICWDETLKCVEKQDKDTIARIYNEYTIKDFVPENIAIDPTRIDDKSACVRSGYSMECLIAKSIWGRCEENPDADVGNKGNQILPITIKKSYQTVPDNTILAWFSENTNDDCRSRECKEGWTPTASGCIPENRDTSDGKTDCFTIFTIYGTWTNCCDSAVKDSFGNCCVNKMIQYVPVDVTNKSGSQFFRSYIRNDTASANASTGMTNFSRVCSPANLQFVAKYSISGSSEYLFCAAIGGTGKMSGKYISGGNAKCDGKFLVVNATTGSYSGPAYTTPSSGLNIEMSYNTTGGVKCRFDWNTSSWIGGGNCSNIPTAKFINFL